jgi:FdhD protein
MASPANLEDFAVGFSLNEGVIVRAEDIVSLEVVDQPLGIELRMRLAPAPGREMARRRRRRAGPVGCGLCGVESLEEAMRPPAAIVSDLVVSPQAIVAAMGALGARQPLNDETRAVHAAGLFRPGAGITHVREDVGRHNALDKLAGALAREGTSARDGIILMTSRVSVELIQKAAAMGAPILAAVSAPTALAVRMASDAGVTIVAVVRADGLEVFSCGWRVQHDRQAADEH